MSNTSSKYLQPTSLEGEENDIAMARIPQPFRDFLLSDMCEFPNPEEMLQNIKTHGLHQTMAVMALFNAHVMREKYGPDHPSIPKLTRIFDTFMETKKCPNIPTLNSASATRRRPVREPKASRRNALLNPPTRSRHG